MLEICVTNPIFNKDWDIFIRSHPEGTIFHTSNWARVIQKTYGYEPYYFVAESNGKIKFGLPFFIVKKEFNRRRLVCLPFTDECPPLFSGIQEKDVISTIIKMIKEKSFKNIEIRNGNIDLFREFNFKTYNYYKLFKLDLTPGLESLWKDFKQKSIRYPIKKAQRYGVEIIKTIEPSDMDVFYKLNLITRKKHGVIPQPYRFFKNILTEIFNAGYGFLLIAKYKDRPIGASIFFTFKDVIYHKFNASDTNYGAYQPNHLILWSVIKWGVENGYKTLDLGRTSPDNKGLMAFKRHWGAQDFDLPYYYWPEIKGASSTKESSWKYQIASSISKKMPIMILKIAGSLFYRYFG